MLWPILVVALLRLSSCLVRRPDQDRDRAWRQQVCPSRLSAMVIPELMPSRRTSWRGSPASSRSFSSCQIGLTMSATGRSGLGKAEAGAPDSAMKSCAETDIVNAAAKTTTIAVRIRSPMERLGASPFTRERRLMKSIASNRTKRGAHRLLVPNGHQATVRYKRAIKPSPLNGPSCERASSASRPRLFPALVTTKNPSVKIRNTYSHGHSSGWR